MAIKLAQQKILLSHHWVYSSQRQPLFSPHLLYLTSMPERGPNVINVPYRSAVDMHGFMKHLGPRWVPDIFIAKVDAFQNIVPRNVGALPCPKILILGDTQHGPTPLQTMIDYAQSEPYDFYITDHKRHHLWYYWLAGIKDLFWLPSLFINPYPSDIGRSRFSDPKLHDALFRDKTVFVGQFGNYHPRRAKLLEGLRARLPNVVYGTYPQRDSLKAFNLARVSLNFSLNGDANLRTFEVLAANGFLISDELAEEAGMDLILERGKDYETFRDPHELIRKVEFFTNNPHEVDSYKRASHQRYLQDYAPDRITEQLERIINHKEVDARYTTKLISRVRYSKHTSYSEDRIALYQIIQCLHLHADSLRIAVDGAVSVAFPEDYLDLPRVSLQLFQYSDQLKADLSRYLRESQSEKRLQYLRLRPGHPSWDVMITTKIVKDFLRPLPDDKVVIFSDKDSYDQLSRENTLPFILSKHGGFFVLRTARTEIEWQGFRTVQK